MTLHLVLLLVAFLCFAIAAVDCCPPRVNLVAMGLALWILTLLIR